MGDQLFHGDGHFLVAEGIVAVFVNVGTADAAAFYLDQDFTGAGRMYGVVLRYSGKEKCSRGTSTGAAVCCIFTR